MGAIKVGMSGWTFEGWNGDFYPPKLPAKKQLSFASRSVNSIEVNGTFYRLQTPETFQRWYKETPEDFVFSIKAPQYITHVRRLKDVEGALTKFIESGLLLLKEKLGPILWQFPPNVILKDDRFESFFKILPSQVDGQRLRHAFEFRHLSFDNPDFLDLMRKHNVAIVCAHCGNEKAPYIEEPTADFFYARMHGQEKQFNKGYTKDFLEEWAKKIKTWSKKGDCFIYFDDESKEFAPRDAMALAQRLKIKETLSKKEILKQVG